MDIMNNRKKNVAVSIFVGLLTILIAAGVIYLIQYRVAINDTTNSLHKELDNLQEKYLDTLPLRESTAEFNEQIIKNTTRIISEIITRSEDDQISDAFLKDICKDLKADNIVIIDTEGNILHRAYPVKVDFSLDRFNQLKIVSQTGEASEGFSVNLDGENNMYYGYPIDENRITVLVKDAIQIQKANEEAFGWESLLANVNPGIDGFTLVGDSRTLEVIWAQNEELIGKSLFDFAKEGQIVPYKLFGIEVSGQDFFAMEQTIEDARVWFMTCIPSDEVDKLITTPMIFITLFFSFCVGLLVSFFIIRAKEGKYQDPRILCKKMLPLTLVSAVFLIFSTYYVETLCSLSIGMMKNENHASNIQKTIKNNKDSQEKISSRNDITTTDKAEIVSYMINRFPELSDREGLSILAEIVGCEEIRIFDTAGRSITSSHGRDGFVLSTDPESQSYEFRRLLNGRPLYCQPLMLNDNGEYRQYAGTTLFDENGDTIGLIQIGVIPVYMINSMDMYSFESTLSSFTTTDNTVSLATNKDEKKIIWYSGDALVGKNALEYGLKDSNFRDNFNGFLTINGKNYFGSCKEDDDHYLFIATRQEDVYRNRIRNVLTNSAVINLLLLALTVIIPYILLWNRESESSVIEKADDSAVRFNFNEPWNDSLTGIKMRGAAKAGFIVVSAVISMLYLFRNVVLSELSIVKYVFDGRWERGINVFSLTACITLVSVICVIVMLLRKLINSLSKTLSPRGETICRLIDSFISIFSVFICIYFSLAFFGVDTSTLLTSAGIMSLVIGLGANKLISDILAGLTIVFDGAIKVGDWIKSGSYEGKVRDIGISSTTLTDSENKVQIIGNSELRAIVNSFVPDFKVSINFGVDFTEPMEKIEDALENERETIQEKHPEIKSGPFISGISDIGCDGYKVTFYIICDGKDSSKMKLQLRDEIRMMFIKYDIKRSDLYVYRSS